MRAAAREQRAEQPRSGASHPGGRPPRAQTHAGGRQGAHRVRRPCAEGERGGGACVPHSPPLVVHSLVAASHAVHLTTARCATHCRSRTRSWSKSLRSVTGPSSSTSSQPGAAVTPPDCARRFSADSQTTSPVRCPTPNRLAFLCCASHPGAGPASCWPRSWSRWRRSWETGAVNGKPTSGLWLSRRPHAPADGRTRCAPPPRVRIIKVDTDEEQDLASQLQARGLSRLAGLCETGRLVLTHVCRDPLFTPAWLTLAALPRLNRFRACRPSCLCPSQRTSPRCARRASSPRRPSRRLS